MGGRSSICCAGARSVRREQPTHQKLGRANNDGRKIRFPRFKNGIRIERRTLDQTVHSASLAPHRCRAIYDEVCSQQVDSFYTLW
jgi:hypothetical protein